MTDEVVTIEDWLAWHARLWEALEGQERRILAARRAGDEDEARRLLTEDLTDRTMIDTHRPPSP